MNVVSYVYRITGIMEDIVMWDTVRDLVKIAGKEFVIECIEDDECYTKLCKISKEMAKIIMSDATLEVLLEKYV